MGWMLPLWVQFWGQYSLFSSVKLEKLVTCSHSQLELHFLIFSQYFNFHIVHLRAWARKTRAKQEQSKIPKHFMTQEFDLFSSNSGLKVTKIEIINFSLTYINLTFIAWISCLVFYIQALVLIFAFLDQIVFVFFRFCQLNIKCQKLKNLMWLSILSKES